MKNLINTDKIIGLSKATSQEERIQAFIKNGELCGGQNFNVLKTEEATYIAINSYGNGNDYSIAVTVTSNECVATICHNTDYGKEVLKAFTEAIEDISEFHWCRIYKALPNKIEEFISIVSVVLSYEYRKLKMI